MSEKQSLLKSDSQLFPDDNNANNYYDEKQVSTNPFSNWRRYFHRGSTNDKKKKPDDDDTKSSDSKGFVGVFELFRFADYIDLVMMFTSIFLVLVHSACFLTYCVILGRLIGLFAVASFGNNCHNQYQNSNISIMSNYDCPFGIELNSFNHFSLHKFCRNIGMMLSSTSATSIPLFRLKVMYLVYWLIIIAVIELIVGGTNSLIWLTTVKRQTSRMSIRLFKSFIQRNVSYLDTNLNSQLNSKLFDNIAKIEQGIGHEFLILIELTVTVTTAIVITFIVSWRLNLIMFLIVSIIIAITIAFSRLNISELVNVLNTYGKAGEIVQEVFSSVRTVLSFNGSKFEQKRYEKELEPTRSSSIRQGVIFGVFIGWTYFISFLVYATGFVFGAILMTHDRRINISDILVIIILLVQNITQLSFVGSYLQSFVQALIAAAPVFRLIKEEEKININELDVWKDVGREKSINIFDDIKFENVNFIHPSRKDVSALHNLNFIARAHQTTALVGSTGSGKSTCLSLLLRYYDPSSGQITIKGKSIKDYNLKQFRQRIGVISQKPILFDMSIYNNIRLGKLNATQGEIEEAAREANAHHFIMALPNRYKTVVGKHGIQLNDGEKQRIALARALVKRPSLLLLNEATSALDNVSEKIVQDALNRACRRHTTIVIAHRLSTIQNADQIYVLDNGNVVEEGTHKTLMENEGGKYQTMVKNQQIEGLDDKKNKIMSIENIKEDERAQILERSNQFRDNKALDALKTRLTSKKQRSIFLRLLSMNSPEWITILIGCLACLFNGAAEPILALLFARVVETFKECIYSKRIHQVVVASFLFLLLGLILWLSRFIQYTAFAISGSKLTQRIRSKTFACLLRQEVAYFDQPEYNSNTINTQLFSKALAVQQIANTRLGLLCEAFAMTFLGLLLGFLFNWELTLIIFIPTLFYILFSYLQVNVSIWSNKETKLILKQANSFLVEVIQNVHTIKHLSVEKEVLQRYTHYIHLIYKTSRKYYFSFAAVYNVYYALNPLMISVLFWRTLILIEQNRLNIKHITIVIAFAFFASQVLNVFTTLYQTLSASVSSAEKFFELFDRTPNIDNGSTEGQKLSDFQGKIEFDQVKFAYPTQPTSIVLNKFRLTIEPGQRVALVGSSGCGKSTIIQLLERFYDVTHGQLLLDGIDIRQLNIQWLRSHFGLISQEPILFNLTVAENISYGLENVSMDDIINAATKANIHSFIEQLPQGYETKVGIKGSFLSTGDKQRIAIARVLLREPKILLLDEPTSAVESYNEQIIQETLEQVQIDDLDRTSLIVAHRLSTIRSCDLICVLDQGRIIESGTHTELVELRGTYYKMLNKDNA